MVGQTRRGVLGSLSKAGVVGIAAGLAGCSATSDLLGGGSNLEVTEVESQVTGWGDVQLSISVENTGSESESGTLYGQVDVQGGDVYSESQQITVPAGETNQYTIDVPIEFQDSLGAEGYQHSAWVETGEGSSDQGS